MPDNPTIVPDRNLAPESQPWGRDADRRIKTLEDAVALLQNTVGNNYEQQNSTAAVLGERLREAALNTPVGGLMPFGGAVAPTGWLACDGSAVSRATYSALFDVIGTTWGVGDGVTTFNVPSLSGRVVAGFESGDPDFGTIAGTGGAKTHTLSTAEMPSHTHIQNSHNHTQNSHNHWTGDSWETVGSPLGNAVASGASYRYTDASDTTGSTTATNNATTATNQNTGGGGAHNNLQPYVTALYIIKY